MTRKYLDDGIKVTKTTLEFGPLKIYRLPSVPTNDFGRNGDIAIIDDTAVPMIDVASGVTPTVTNLCQKVGGVWVCGLGAVPGYSNVTGGDGGTATASVSGDSLTINGAGIHVTAVDAASPLDALNLVLDIADLAAGGGVVTLADELALDVAGTTFRYSLTKLVQDLDMPYGITTNGLITRTAADTYASRSIAVSGAGAEDGLAITDGNGVAGDPTVGLDITGLPARSDAVDIADRVAVYNVTTGANEYYTVNELAGAIASADSFKTWLGAGNTSGDASVVADAAADTVTITGGIGINIDFTSLTDTVEWEFARVGMADTAVQGADTVPFFDATNSNEPEYRSWSDIITDLGLLTSGNQVIFTSLTGDTGTATADTNADSAALVGATNGGITTVASDGPEQITFGITPIDLATGVATLAATDYIIVSDSVDGVTALAQKYTFQDVIDDLNLTVSGVTNAYSSIAGGDGGTTAAAIGSDTITVNGSGINVTTTNGGAGLDTLDLVLDISDLSAGAGVLLTTDEIAVNDGGTTVRYAFSDMISDLGLLTSSASFYWKIIDLTGNTAVGSDNSIAADAPDDTLELDGGTGITLNGDESGTDSVSIAFSRAGMADTAVVAADTVPFFDSGNSDEPEYRSWANVITDLGLLTSGNQTVFTSITGDTGSGSADTNSDSAAFIGAASGGITTVASDDPEQVTFSITPVDLVTGSATLTTGDFIIVSDSTDSATTLAQKYTFQDVIDDLNLTVGGITNAYSNIAGGDGGTTAAAIGSDTITFNGEGINITTANGAAGLDTVAFDLDVSDLTAGTTVALTDVIAVDQGADPNVKFAFTDVVEDLDIPNAITVNGLVTRTAADTYASRTIVASSDEDELGAAVSNGNGVAGNPSVGIDVVGLTDPDDPMSATDEFIVHDKSEGTAGANRKMTGQNIADGVLAIEGLELSTIDGEIILTFNDTTRTKRLSVETVTVMWNDPLLSANEYLEMGGAAHADLGFVLPHDATLVKATGAVGDNNGNSRDIDLYVNQTLDTASILSFSGASGPDTDADVTLDIDLSAGDVVTLRGDSTSGDLDDIAVVLFFKWRT